MRKFVGESDWENILLKDQNVNTWKSNIEKVIETALQKYVPNKKITGNVNKKKKRSFEAPDFLLTHLHNKRKAFRYYKKIITKTTVFIPTLYTPRL